MREFDMADELLTERRGDVLFLTLNRPEVHNALNASMTEALVAAFEGASLDDTLRAVVLTSSGERTFCSGADLKESAGGMFSSVDGSNPIGNVLRAIQICRKLVVARVNGSALAGGLGLVAACDLAYAAGHAKFGLPEVRVGLFPMMVATVIKDQMPRRRFQEMVYLGDLIDAAEARQYGLINAAVPAAQLDRTIEDVLARIRLNSPAAITTGKKAILDMQDMSKAEMLAYAERMIAALGDSQDAREGRAAFAEKRMPRWTNTLADDVSSER
jgi:enoyl-CoA hydratase/carnithine racemase